MSRGEFYRTNEHNAVSEYQHFPAELYLKPKEENPCGPEGADLGKETTSLQKKRAVTPNRNGAKTLIDKLFGSIRGVAVASTVAVASAVITTALITSAPQTELVHLDCGATYVEYQMEISGLQEDDEYAIVITSSLKENIELEVDGDGTYQNKVEGLTPEWEYTLSLVRYDTTLGEVRHFETKFQTLPYSEPAPVIPVPEPTPTPAPTPHIAVSSVSIVGINEIQIQFTHQDVPENATVEFDLLYGDLTTGKAVATSEDLARGYLTARMETSDSLTVTPTVTTREGENQTQTVCEGYTHTFEATFAVQTMVGLYNQTVTFYPTGITNGAEYIHITSSANPDAPEIATLEGVVTVWYQTAEEITYTMYFTNEDGDVLSNEVSVTVDTSINLPTREYNFSYLNPNNIGITYNDDGTINMYFQTGFETEEEDVYYQITLGDLRFTSREKVARVEGIPDTSYILRYDVCVDVDGVQYSIFHVTPSGVANENALYFASEFIDNTLTLQLYKEELHLDMNSIKLISDSGEEIVLSETDFVYNENTGTYDVVVEFTQPFTQVTVQMFGNPYYNGLTDIDGYVGNTRKLFEETVYLP